MTHNPLIEGKKVGKFEVFPFDEIKTEHYMPAIEAGLIEAKENIEKIKNDPATPTFENTILAMDNTSDILEDASNIFFNLLSSESDDKFQALAQKIGPMLSEFGSSIMLDPKLFARVKTVYENMDNLNDEQKRLVDNNYKSFVRNGALLNDEAKAKLTKLDMEMAQLGPQFSQNVMAQTNAFEHYTTDETELAGIPQMAKDAAAHLAKAKGKESGWMFNLQIPSLLPIVTYADNRELRKKFNLAYGSRALGGKFDNQEIVKRIASIRYERAVILGYKTHADYTLEMRMAENFKNVQDFYDRIYDVAMPIARKEKDELENFAKELDGIDMLMPWDAGYYAEKLKKKLFDFDEEELRPFFKIENVVAGAFEVATKLYGLQFTALKDIPLYHKDVKVYEVTDGKNEHVGLLYVDLFPRETKRGGAWMTRFRSQGLQGGKMMRPLVSIVANLTPSTPDNPSLITMNEATTIFHEFGHALHALLSDCTYTSLSSPNVYWDFVELPSQIMENWVYEKEALDLFAKHYKTGETMPMEMIEKVKKAKNFMAAGANIRQLSLGMVDFGWHGVDPRNIENVVEYENKILEKTSLYPKTDTKNTSCSFSHIFHGGYSSGYYSYKWAEVLEADAFELFLEKGIFDKETAASFRDNILSKGNTKHPMDLYVDFRGRKPDADAMLKRDGLI